MSSALIATLVAAIAIAISPFRITAVIALLVAPKARQLGSLFLAGYVLAIAVVSALCLSAALKADFIDDLDQSTLNGLINLGMGLGLISIATWVWRKRPQQGQEPQPPKWMHIIDGFGSGTAILFGAGMAVISFKNLTLIVTAMLAVGAAEVSDVAKLTLYVLFVAISSLGVAIPVLWRILAGSTAEIDLARLKKFLAANNAIIMTISLSTMGLLLTIRGLMLLA